MIQSPLSVLARVNWWLVLIVATICSISVMFLQSATSTGDEGFRAQPMKQTLFLCISALVGLGIVLVPYARIMRSAWTVYGIVLVALLLLPFFGPLINGARRWYYILGIGVQPSEFAKLAVIMVLASWLRFRNKARTMEGLVIPIVITAVPVLLIFKQPDLGSSLVFWPVLLAMCYVAGTPRKQLGWLFAIGCVGLLVAALTVSDLLHDYQKMRLSVWADHFTWTQSDISGVGERSREIQTQLRGDAYQPWQSLIAIGSGGWTGFGVGQGPQNQFDFLPYRSVDYIFAVICEEAGLLGALGLMAFQLLLVGTILGIGMRSRERFGRLVAVGVATYLGTQTLLHIAVCVWLVPATGLPMPLVSYGGSSTLVAISAIALVINVGARREPVLSADGFA